MGFECVFVAEKEILNSLQSKQLSVISHGTDANWIFLLFVGDLIPVYNPRIAVDIVECSQFSRYEFFSLTNWSKRLNINMVYEIRVCVHESKHARMC